MGNQEATFLLRTPEEVSQLLSFLRARGLDCEPTSTGEVAEKYFDSKDLQLLRKGWTYAWRNGASRPVLVLTPVARPGSREPSGPAIGQPIDGLPRSPAKPPKGPVRKHLREQMKGHEPVELFRLKGIRTQYVLRASGEPVARMEIDEAEVVSSVKPGKLAPGQMRFYEVGLTAEDGSAAELADLPEDLERWLGLRHSRLTWFERGLQAVGLEPPEVERQERYAIPVPGAPLAAFAYHCFEQEFRTILRHEARAWEGLEPEGVHQMRVGTRRLRAAFRVFRSVLDDRATRAFRADFRWLAQVLGAVRDLDVYQDNFRKYLSHLEPETVADLGVYRASLHEEREEAQRKLVEALKGERYAQLVERFRRFLEKSPPEGLNSSSPTVSDAAPRIIGRALRQVRKQGRQVLPGAPPQDYHELRITCKRLRYTGEFFAPYYGKRMRRFTRQLKEVQDILGDHQDACVAAERVHARMEFVRTNRNSPDQLAALAQLFGVQRYIASEKRPEFHKAWVLFDRKKTWRRIRKMLKSPKTPKA